MAQEPVDASPAGSEPARVTAVHPAAAQFIVVQQWPTHWSKVRPRAVDRDTAGS